MFSSKYVNICLSIMWASAISSLGLSIYDLNTPRIIGNIGNLLIVAGIHFVLRNGYANKFAVTMFTIGPVFATVSAAMYIIDAEYAKMSSQLITFAMAIFYMKLFYMKEEMER